MTTIGLPSIASTSAIMQNYVNALNAVGADALILPVTMDEAVIRQQLKRCDGLILIGGTDLSPSLYGETIHPAVSALLTQEQAFFYTTIANIILKETDKPVLGVCLGNQMINVCFGGSLFQDIVSQIPDARWHSRPAQDHTLETMHTVAFPLGSPLTAIIGKSDLCVNSSHHQAIKSLGNGLKTAAVAPDGVIEAVCNDNFNSRFILGVQWHPERLFDKVDGHKQILQALVNACRQHDIRVCTPNRTLIQGGELCDGTGEPARKQDILIEDDRIIALLPPNTPAPADTATICAEGLTVAPGFIDAHSHFDVTKLNHPQNRTKLLQGVTTEVLGNCGSSPVCIPGNDGPFSWTSLADYAELLDGSSQSTNSVVLCGHNDIRQAVMGQDNRPPTEDELRQMKKMVREALDKGAAGLSSGLTYFPGKYADTSELIALASDLHGKVYASHIRSEGDALLEAADEAVAIAEKAGCRLQVSHIKTMFPRNFSKIQPYIEKLENARKRDIPVHADRYPYIYSQTVLRQILPPPFDKIPDISGYIAQSQAHFREIAASLEHSPRDLASTILLNQPWRGLTLQEAAGRTGKSMQDLATELLRDAPGCHAAYKAMSQQNLERFLALPWVCAGSDGLAFQLDAKDSYGHPRSVGTFPRFFRMLADTIGTAEAIRRMTSLPAAIFNIPQRGIIRNGFFADIVILDSNAFDSKADFTNDAQKPDGLKCVIVNGQVSYKCDTPEAIGAAGKFIPVH